MNFKNRKALAVLKEGLQRKREQATHGGNSDAVEHGVATFIALLPSGTQRHYTSSEGV